MIYDHEFIMPGGAVSKYGKFVIVIVFVHNYSVSFIHAHKFLFMSVYAQLALLEGVSYNIYITIMLISNFSNKYRKLSV